MLSFPLREARTLLLVAASSCTLAGGLLAGDFNNDGFDDLALGVPGETVGNVPAGAVAILYGRSGGISATAVPDQVFHQDSPGVPGSAELGDAFGSMVIAGDFNGDGFDDLAVGVKGEDFFFGGSNKPDAGVISLIFGSAAGLSTTAIALQQFRAATPRQFTGFGSVMAADDFDDDGFDDLAIGIAGDVVGTITAGTVQVLYGTPTGPDSANRQIWSQNSSGVLDSSESGDAFGCALACSDFDNNGTADLAIGAFGEDLATSNVGMVHVFFSIPGTGLTASSDLTFAQGVGGVPGIQTSDDRFGFSLAAIPHGVSGLAIGCPNDFDSPLRSGSVLVLPPNGLSVAGSTFISQNIVAGFAAPTASDKFGSSLVLSDFGRLFFPSGGADLVIGVPGGTGLLGTNLVPNAGLVIVLYGRNGSFDFAHPQRWGQGNAGLAEVAESGDAFGSVLCAGNYGKDSLQDLVIGVPAEDSGLVDTGVAHVLYADILNGLSATGSQVWSQDSSSVEEIAEIGDRFGSSASGR